jgi:O-antigen/teichoic acid export membrane protein
MTSVRRALALSFAERYALIAIALCSNILVARLLTPEQIGIYSVSLAVISIAQVLREFGIGNFLIQEKNLSEAHIRTTFGISLLIGSGLFVIVYFIAPFAGNFYSKVQMVQTLRISALNFLTLPFCTISLALLRRDMAFNQLVIVNLIAASMSSAMTIGLAYWGFGPNSMAIGAVVGNIATGIGAWIARSDRKLLLPGFSEWRAILRFGSQSSLANIVTTISMDINDLVLGKMLGFAPVAMISRAKGLMNLFHQELMSAIRNVAFPAFARAHREGESIEARHIFSVSAVTVIAWPLYGFTALFALEILRLMFGPQWDEAASLVPIFCLAGAVAATSNLVLSAILAIGRIDLVTKFELIFQPLRAALIVGAAMIFQSLIACAIAFCVAFVIYTPFVYTIKERCIPNNYRNLCMNLWASFKVTLITLALPAAFAVHLGLDRNTPANPITLITVAAFSAISWLIALIIFKHPVTTDPLFSRFTSKLPDFA